MKGGTKIQMKAEMEMVLDKKTAKSKVKVVEKIDEVIVDPLLIMTTRMKIMGITPFLMNKMADKDKLNLLNKQKGQPGEKVKIRNIEEELENKIHRLSNGTVGIPVVAIKKSMVEAAPILGMEKRQVRGGLFIIAEEGNLVPLKYKKREVNESTTRDSGIGRTPRTTFRPQFNDWSCEFTVKYNAKQITTHQIVSLLKIAGFHVGLGSWRPLTDGNFGTFTVA